MSKHQPATTPPKGRKGKIRHISLEAHYWDQLQRIARDNVPLPTFSAAIRYLVDKETTGARSD